MSRLAWPLRADVAMCMARLHPARATLRSYSTTPSTRDAVVAAARAAVERRLPQPDEDDASRTLYRPSVPQTLSDRLQMHWRGHPIDLNHTHDMWARKESGAFSAQSFS